MLTENFDLTGIDGYSLRHLGHHLCVAGRAGELHKLLALENQVASNQASNFWFAAHDYAGSLTSYLDDIDRAWADCAHTTDEALSTGEVAASFGLEIRYVLMAGAVATRANNITTDLLGMTVSAGLWSPHRALDHAHRLTRAGDRLRAFNTLRPLLSPEQQDDLNAEALESVSGVSDGQRGEALAALAAHLASDLLERAVAVADSISDEASRARALTGLAPYVAVEQRKDILIRALAAAAAISRWSVSLDPPGSPERATALADLAPQLPDDLLDLALSSAVAISNADSRADALAGLAPYLSETLLARALRIVPEFDSMRQPRVLGALARHLPASLRPRAIAVARAIKNDFSRREALQALIPYLPEDLRTQAMDNAGNQEGDRARDLLNLTPHLPADAFVEAIGAARSTENIVERAKELALLASHVAADRQRSIVLSMALSAVEAFAGTYQSDRIPEVLAVLGPQLPADLLARALDIMTAIGLETSRGECLAALAPYLHGDLIVRALSAAAAIRDGQARAHALARMVPYAPAERRLDVLRQAVAAASATEDAWHRAAAVSRLAPYARQERQHAILAYAVSAVSAIGNNASRARVLTELAPRLPADLIAQTLEIATAISSDTDRADALAGLAPYLPADLLPVALARVTEIPAPWTSLGALPSFVPYLPADQKAAVISEISALGDALPAYMDVARLRVTALTRVAPYLSADDLDQAVTVAANLTADDSRARALTALAPWMPEDRRKTVLAQAVKAVAEISDGRAHISALKKLVPHLPPEMLPRAVTGVTGIEFPPMRLEALVAIAAHLPVNLLSHVVTVVISVADQRARARALAGLAPYLPAELLGSALTSATAMTDEDAKATALAGLIPHLPADERPAALNEALAAAKAARPAGRAAAFAAIATCLPVGEQQLLLSEALTAAAATEESVRARILRGLAPHLPGDLIAGAMATAASITNEWERANALNSLVPYADAAQLVRAIDASPKSRTRLLATAISAKTRSGHSREARTACVRLIRAGMTGADRHETLNFIGSAARTIADIGGIAAIDDCVEAIDAVYRWWD